MQNYWSGTTTTVQAQTTPRLPDKTHSLAILINTTASKDPEPLLLDQTTSLEGLSEAVKAFLQKLKLAADQSLKAVVVQSKDVTATATQTKIQALIAKAYGVMPFSLLVVEIDADKAFATALDAALTAERTQKNNITAITRFKPIGDGESETAATYVTEFKTDFDALSVDHLGLLLPFNKPSQLATLAGELVSVPIQQEPGWMGVKASTGAEFDHAFFAANQPHYKAGADARAIVYKVHPEAPTQIKSNGTFNLHSSSSTITSIPTARVVDKLEDQIRVATLPFVNSHIFVNRGPAEQKFVEGTVQQALNAMQEAGEIASIEKIEAIFDDNSLNISYKIKPILHTSNITNTITITAGN